MRESLKRWCRTAGLVALVTGSAAAGAHGQEWHEFRAARQANDVRSLEVQLRYGAGEVRVGRSEFPFLYDARLRYDALRFDPVRAFTRERDRGRLRLAVSPVDGDSDDAHVRIDDWNMEFDLEELSRDAKELGELELRLHPSVPTDLQLGLGAAEARLDLGGLSLTSFTLVTGASDAELGFDEPNRSSMRRLSLTSGAAAFRAEGLGNARFEEMEFNGFIGDIVLDFGGAWERDARARIKIAVGELTIRVPRDLGVRIRRSSLLASLRAEGFEEAEGTLVSPNWDSAEHRLELELSSGFGTIQVERG